MKLTTVALASAGLCLCGWAQAQPASTHFTLTQAPALSDDGVPPPGQAAAGRWISSGSSANADIELASGDITSASGNSGPVENFWNEGFGDSVASVRDVSGSRLTASARVLDDSLRATVDVTRAEPSDSGTANARWRGSFELNPHSSVTLSGIGSFEKGGVSAPVQGIVDPFDRECSPYRFPSWSGGCSETMTAYHLFPSEATEWGEFSLRGGFDDLTPAQIEDLGFETLAAARLGGFSYSTGPNGEVSLTLTNHLDVASTGYFELQMGMMSTAAPIPEPAAYLCMLLGLGALGGFARWRAKA